MQSNAPTRIDRTTPGLSGTTDLCGADVSYAGYAYLYFYPRTAGGT